MSKRVLVISPTPTHPMNAGNRIRIKQLIDALSELGHEVHLLVASRERSDPHAMRAWLNDRFHLVPYHWHSRRETIVGKMRRWLRQAIDSDARHLWHLDDWYDPALDSELKRLHSSYKFDVVIVEYVFFSRALECFGAHVLKVLDTHDCFTMRHRLYLKMGLPAQFFSTTEADEARGLERADLVLAIQDAEREFFSRITRRPVITVGHLVTIEQLFEPKSSENHWDVLFVGSANAINIQAVRDFLRDTWPLVRASIPQARLLLAGAVCDTDFEGDAVVRLGFVDDLRSVYRRARVVVNPVRNSTGLNIKSIEALGYGMPFVTSAAGARGIDSGNGQCFIVADAPSEMASAIVNLQRDEALSRKLSAAALAYARSWNEVTLGQLALRLGRSLRTDAVTYPRASRDSAEGN